VKHENYEGLGIGCHTREQGEVPAGLVPIPKPFSFSTGEPLICPRNAEKFGHTVTEEERKQWCADVRGKVKCAGCPHYEELGAGKVEVKKKQGGLW
jgi:hypothetical protein